MLQDTDFVIKQGWMVKQLHLTGSSLEIYALVWGYTKDGETWYTTNVANICEWLACSERTVQNHLLRLSEADYIIRKESKYGRSASLDLRVNTDIVKRALKGEDFKPLRKVRREKGATIAPLKRVQLSTEKGATFSETPIIKIYIKDNISILFPRVYAREGQEEKEIFKSIFFFMGAAVPAAEAVAFLNYNKAVHPDWNDLGTEKKAWYASQWQMKNGVRKVSDAWLAAWAGLHDWAVRNDPSVIPALINPAFYGLRIKDGEKVSYIFRCTVGIRQWINNNNLYSFLAPLVEGLNREDITWNYV